jgi:hypothetical protein
MAFLLHVGTFDNQAVNGSMGIFTCREKAEQFIAGDRFVFPCMREPSLAITLVKCLPSNCGDVYGAVAHEDENCQSKVEAAERIRRSRI